MIVRMNITCLREITLPDNLTKEEVEQEVTNFLEDEILTVDDLEWEISNDIVR